MRYGYSTAADTSGIMQHCTAGERRVARTLVARLLAEGCMISVYDGEAWPVIRSRSRQQILDALCTTEEDRLVIRDATGKHIGSVLLVWGNDPSGEELVADHTSCQLLDSICEGI